MLLGEALELWTTALAAEGRSPHTVKAYREHLRPVFRYLEGQGIPEAEALSPFPIRRYLADYLEGHSPHGSRSIFTSIRAFCNWLVGEGLLSESPVARLKPPKASQTSKAIYRPGEMKALASALSSDNTPAGLRDAAIVALLMDTGARASEVTELRLQDIQGEALLLRRTKTGRPRMLFLGKKSSQALTATYPLGGRSSSPRTILCSWAGRAMPLPGAGCNP